MFSLCFWFLVFSSIVTIGYIEYAEFPQYGVNHQMDSFLLKSLRLINIILTILSVILIPLGVGGMVISYSKSKFQKKYFITFLLLIYFLIMRYQYSEIFFWVYD
jgi:hypothetical protein